MESELSRALEFPVISLFSHTGLDDTFEIAGSMGIGGVKQAARSRVWQARRQTEHILSVPHAAGGLFKPTLPRSWRQKT